MAGTGAELALKSMLLRAARAAADITPLQACMAAGIGEGDLADAEAGRRLSEGTWSALVSVYAERGIDLVIGVGGGGVLIGESPSPF